MGAVRDDFAYLLPRLFPLFRGWLVPFAGYFDDTDVRQSGVTTHTAVAGVLFEPEGAQEFVKAWARMCPPLSAPFRTAECASGWGQFRGWGKERCNKLLDELAYLIADTRGPLIATSVLDEGEFEKFRATNPAAETAIPNRYTLNLFSCIKMVGDWCEENGRTELIEYMFEMGTVGEGEAARFLSRAVRVPQLKERFRIAGYGFHPKDNASALVAADFVAWEVQYNARHQEGLTDRIRTLSRNKDQPFLITTHSAEAISLWGMHNWFYRLHEDTDLPEDYSDTEEDDPESLTITTSLFPGRSS